MTKIVERLVEKLQKAKEETRSSTEKVLSYTERLLSTLGAGDVSFLPDEAAVALAVSALQKQKNGRLMTSSLNGTWR